MNTIILPTGPYQANCIILWQEAEAAWIVDPGADAPAIRDALASNGLRPGCVVLTHGHFDHVGAVNDVIKDYGNVPVYIAAEDAVWAFTEANQTYGYPPTKRPATLDTSKNDGDEIVCGELNAKVLKTPGHSPGSWCMLFAKEKLLLTGDTLFHLSYGRTDFPGGNWRQMGESLARLAALPEDLRVICGHGPETTIAIEKRENPYFQE